MPESIRISTQREGLTDRGFGRRRSWTRWEKRRLRRKVSGRRFRGIQWRKGRWARIGIRGLTRPGAVGRGASEALRHVRWWGWLARSRKWRGRLSGWVTDIRWGVKRWRPLSGVARYVILLRIRGRLERSGFFRRSLGAEWRQVRIRLLANCKNTWAREWESVVTGFVNTTMASMKVLTSESIEADFLNDHLYDRLSLLKIFLFTIHCTN